MNCVKSILFIPIVESNLEIIICKNKNFLYEQNLRCFKKKHNIYFFMSIFCFLILNYMTYIFITFSFNKVTHINGSVSKYLIMNSSKSFFFNKLTILIIQSINSIYSLKKIICFSFFCVSYIHLYCFIIEYHYQDEGLIHNKIYFYINFIYIVSTTILFFGYIISKYNFE